MSKNRTSHGLLLVAAVSFLSTGMGFAQMQGAPAGGRSQTTQEPGTLPETSAPHDQMKTSPGAGGASQEQMDKHFVHAALQGGMAEVALGKLALEKSSNDEVKKFAQRMVDDHTKMGDDMKPVAQQVGVKVPEGLSKPDQMLETKLQALSGGAFDKAYVQAMVKDHKKDLSDFQREAEHASIPAVKDAAQKGEPIIKAHLDHVQQLAKSNMASTGMSAH